MNNTEEVIEKTSRQWNPHTQSNETYVDIVWKTTKYDMFNTTEYNRTVTEEYVYKLMASFAEKDLRKATPIIVNEQMEVVDGGNRLEARKRLKLPIYYIVVEGLSAKNDIARLNMDRKGWTYPDWHAHYIQRDQDAEDGDTTFENYPLLAEFMKAHKFNFGISLGLFCLNKSTNSLYGRFKKGILTYPNPNRSDDLATWMGVCAEHLKEKSKNFLIALWFIYDNKEIDNAAFEKLLSKKKNKIEPGTKNSTQWIQWIDEQILDKRIIKDKDPLYLQKLWAEYQKKEKEQDEQQKKSLTDLHKGTPA
jgi:hypothetical protein